MGEFLQGLTDADGERGDVDHPNDPATEGALPRFDHRDGGVGGVRVVHADHEGRLARHVEPVDVGADDEDGPLGVGQYVLADAAEGLLRSGPFAVDPITTRSRPPR